MGTSASTPRGPPGVMQKRENFHKNVTSKDKVRSWMKGNACTQPAAVRRPPAFHRIPACFDSQTGLDEREGMLFKRSRKGFWQQRFFKVRVAAPRPTASSQQRRAC